MAEQNWRKIFKKTDTVLSPKVLKSWEWILVGSLALGEPREWEDLSIWRAAPRFSTGFLQDKMTEPENKIGNIILMM